MGGPLDEPPRRLLELAPDRAFADQNEFRVAATAPRRDARRDRSGGNAEQPDVDSVKNLTGTDIDLLHGKSIVRFAPLFKPFLDG